VTGADTNNWAHRYPHDGCWCVVGIDDSYVGKIMGSGASFVPIAARHHRRVQTETALVLYPTTKAYARQYCAFMTWWVEGTLKYTIMFRVPLVTATPEVDRW